MAELAVTDGRPPPSGLPDGECILTRLVDGSLRVDQADPRILISAELIDEIGRHPTDQAWIHLDNGTGVLKIHGVNRQVIYRLGEYVHRVHGYIGEWPD